MVIQAAAKPVAGATKKGAQVTAKGAKKGAQVTAKGVKKGAGAAARGVGKGAQKAAGKGAQGARTGSRAAGKGARGAAGAPGKAGGGRAGAGRAGRGGLPSLPGRGGSGRLGGGRSPGRSGQDSAGEIDQAGASDAAVARAAGVPLRAGARVAGAVGRLVRARLSPRRMLRLSRKARKRRRKKKKVTLSLAPLLLCGLMLIPLSLGLFGGTTESPGWRVQGDAAGDVSGIPYAEVFNKTKEQGIDPRLLAAVAWVETNGFTPGIIDCTEASASGRLGIMQVPPGIAEDLGADPCKPEQAIPLGADLLVKLFEKYGSWDVAVTAYHMLPNQDGEVPAEDPSAPGGYLEKVKATWDQYKAMGSLDAGLVFGVPFADIFNKAGTDFGIDPRLLAAVAWQESIHFKPSVIACEEDSPDGARGIMQFMPATAAERGVDPCKPESAIPGAAKYLVEMYKEFGTWELALAGYNAGPDAVRQAGRTIPPIPETQAYVPLVMGKYGEYQKQFPTGQVMGITDAPGPPVGSTAWKVDSHNTPWMQALLDAAVPRFGQSHGIGCFRNPDPSMPSQHPVGQACDFMMSEGGTRAVGAEELHGHQFSTWLIQNVDSLHIRYIIWQQKIWERTDPHWRQMDDRHGISANHFDHVHVSVQAAPGERSVA